MFQRMIIWFLAILSILSSNERYAVNDHRIAGTPGREQGFENPGYASSVDSYAAKTKENHGKRWLIESYYESNAHFLQKIAVM